MAEWQLVLIIIPAFAVLGFLFWNGVVMLVSVMSGWRRLAAEFETTYTPSGAEFKYRTGRLRRVSNYSGTLNVVVAPEGLRLSTIVFFRAGHAPVLIPWSYIRSADSADNAPPRFINLHINSRLNDQRLATIQLWGRDLAQAIWPYLQVDENW